MLTIKHALEYVTQGEWFVSIDLKDAYFHIPIVNKHRKFLRFAFQGVCYEYNWLPFGYMLAPRTFTKVIKVALNPLCSKGMRICST